MILHAARALIEHTLGPLLLAVTIGVMGRDFYAWLPRVQVWLLKSAAARVPAEIRTTYYEECLAEVEQLPSAELSRTLMAFGFLVAAWHISLERLEVLTLLESVGVRSLDIVLSICSITFLAPMLFVIALVIKREDAGPALFAKRVVGRGARHFNMLQFRTMSIRTDEFVYQRRETFPGIYEEFSLLIKQKNGASRMTRSGRWLRRTGLDALAQFYNVLRGDMTLVGPGPCTAEAFQDLSETTREAYRSFKPGMTSPSALQGLVGEEAYVADCKYMKSRNLITDARTMVLTVASFITGH